jgi:ATP-dependent RNA helicase RhlE
MQQGVLDLGQVQILVLDEADRMLDMGFIHDVKKVLAAVPKDKQPAVLGHLQRRNPRTRQHLLKNPQSVQVTPRNTTVQRITQVIHPVGRGKKKPCSPTSSRNTTGARCWCSRAPSSAPTTWPNS